MSIDIIKSNLINYPLYELSDSFYFLNKENIYFGWHKGNQHSKECYFSAQITDGIFYILEIGISKKYRGQGLGERLYLILEEIAKEFKCSRIEMTASGTTFNQESRLNYLCRKLSYKVSRDNVVIKELK